MGNFHKVTKRAMIACENSGHIIVDDFPEVRKIVSAAVTSKPVKVYLNSGISSLQKRHMTQGGFPKCWMNSY